MLENKVTILVQGLIKSYKNVRRQGDGVALAWCIVIMLMAYLLAMRVYKKQA